MGAVRRVESVHPMHDQPVPVAAVALGHGELDDRRRGCDQTPHTDRDLFGYMSTLNMLMCTRSAPAACCVTFCIGAGGHRPLSMRHPKPGGAKRPDLLLRRDEAVAGA